MLRPAWLLAPLDRSDLEITSQAAEGFYFRAFPKLGHPFLESDITTRQPWGGYRDRTFTGWIIAFTG